jgi:hypothetical protein
MRTTTLALFALLACATTSLATTGTCTITGMAQTGVGESDFGFPIPVAAGVVMPVEFDEASGTFSMSRDGWYAQFGDTGATFVTVGVDSFLRMKPGTDVGTIEGDGTVAFPSFEVFFATSFSGPTPPYPDLAVKELTFTTGISPGHIPGLSGTKRGARLDFGTGSLTLSGIGIIEGAPGTSGPLLSGLEMTCTLAPIPSATSLPVAPVFAKLKGKSKTGSNGDAFSLKGVIGDSPVPLPLATAKNLILDILPAGSTTPVLSVRIATLAQSGKKLVASRDDTCKLKRGATQGTCKRDGTTVCTAPGDCAENDVVEILAGGKQDAGVTAKIAVAEKSKGTNVQVVLGGLDLSALSGAVTVELWAQGRAATKDATVSGTTKKKIK